MNVTLNFKLSHLRECQCSQLAIDVARFLADNQPKFEGRVNLMVTDDPKVVKWFKDSPDGIAILIDQDVAVRMDDACIICNQKLIRIGLLRGLAGLTLQRKKLPSTEKEVQHE